MTRQDRVPVRSYERRTKNGKRSYVKPQRRKFPKKKEIIIKKPENYKKQIPKRKN